MSKQQGWLVIGYVKERPRDSIEHVLGVFTPTRCDGIYFSLSMAHGVAACMRESLLRPDEIIDVVQIEDPEAL